ncbi:MAG TPA: YdcF family protein [Candidatus Saccharimonadia bacterium]
MKAIMAFLITTTVLLVLAALGVLGIGFFLSPQNQLRDADLIVAVSGGETQQRTAEAVKLYQQGRASKLLFSGAAADPNAPSNAAVMRADALSQGVPDSAILIEELSANTQQNAEMAVPIIRSLNAKTIILVTSPYHQRRASLNFHQAVGRDVTILNHSASDSSWRKSSWWQQEGTIGLTLSELQKTFYVWSVRRQES